MELYASRKTRSANQSGLKLTYRFPHFRSVFVRLKYTSNMALCNDNDVNDVTAPQRQIGGPYPQPRRWKYIDKSEIFHNHSHRRFTSTNSTRSGTLFKLPNIGGTHMLKLARWVALARRRRSTIRTRLLIVAHEDFTTETANGRVFATTLRRPSAADEFVEIVTRSGHRTIADTMLHSRHLSYY